jgi:hypothetical protein
VIEGEGGGRVGDGGVEGLLGLLVGRGRRAAVLAGVIEDLTLIVVEGGEVHGEDLGILVALSGLDPPFPGAQAHRREPRGGRGVVVVGIKKLETRGGVGGDTEHGGGAA